MRGVEAAAAPVGDDRWVTAVSNAHLPETTCDDIVDTPTAFVLVKCVF